MRKESEEERRKEGRRKWGMQAGGRRGRKYHYAVKFIS